jgi:hypothetical protein
MARPDYESFCVHAALNDWHQFERSRLRKAHYDNSSGRTGAIQFAARQCTPLEVDMSHAARSALVLQGGGALGAYELGAARRLYEDDHFAPDVIAGVSIGAITAVLLARPAKGLKTQRGEGGKPRRP